ncbi:hypothetical protein [Methanoregula formicica]|uniref:hypothetical protein n=1 Tax=Methanoregula formicica TaxID=882104 RepID=UPI00130EBCDF|nr:hypothetical protein [Methanoregula formicica]
MHSVISLLIILVAMLFIAGCTTAPVSENQTMITTATTVITPSPVVTSTPQSKVFYTATIAQQNSSHPERIRMDSDVYNKGEIIEFYLVNEGPDAITCIGELTECRIFFWKNESNWEELPRPVGAYYPPATYQLCSVSNRGPSYLGAGQRTPVFHLITTKWVPGRYKIQSDCLNASREFILRNTTTI